MAESKISFSVKGFDVSFRPFPGGTKTNSQKQRQKRM